jgi:hypothetical protein
MVHWITKIEREMHISVIAGHRLVWTCDDHVRFYNLIQRYAITLSPMLSLSSFTPPTSPAARTFSLTSPAPLEVE